jgi:predicted nuclease with TOPRIM domain
MTDTDIIEFVLRADNEKLYKQNEELRAVVDELYDAIGEHRNEIERLREHIKQREDDYAGILTANEAEIERLKAENKAVLKELGKWKEPKP